MDRAQHNIHSLFEQLGLPAGDAEIEHFIEAHRPLPPGLPLHCADFWNESQANFLAEAIAEDADWAEVVDELDVCLRSMVKPQRLPDDHWLSRAAESRLPELY